LADRLLTINVDGRGRLLLQTVWQVGGDAQGRRRTDIEEPTNLKALTRRLAELAAKLLEPEVSSQLDGEKDVPTTLAGRGMTEPPIGWRPRAVAPHRNLDRNGARMRSLRVR
jgi:hypothetical protein